MSKPITNYKQSLIALTRLMRMEKPVGTVLLAMPMLWALWLAGDGQPDSKTTLIFLLGAFVMRSAGCVINDIADRKIDGHVERTQMRPLASGEISLRGAILLFLGLLTIAIVLLWLLPQRALYPAMIAVALAIIYPFTKRFFDCPQLVLGAAFSSSILMVYIVIQARLPLAAWLLMLATICWTVVYDTFYALVDKPDDEKVGVKSSARWFGEHVGPIILGLMVSFQILMLIVGLIHSVNGYYYLGLVLSMGCFLYQWQCYLRQTREAFFSAFLNNQWVGVLIFLGIVLAYLPR